jgi:sec-independent protein translocase protein TatB
MFDFAWSEIALIGVVALVLIGPKDLPVAIKAVTTMIKKARRMAAEFQTHVDDMVKDADLSEVREQFREIRSMDIRGAITRAVDGDGTIREAFKDPMRTPPPPVMPSVETTTPMVDTPAPLAEVVVERKAEHTIDLTPPSAPFAQAPAFIPPANARPPRPAPAFIPPEAKPPSQYD